MKKKILIVGGVAGGASAAARLRRLGEEEKEDIIKNINNLLMSGKIEYINQVKSLEKLLNVLNVKVVNYKESFKLKKR